MFKIIVAMVTALFILGGSAWAQSEECNPEVQDCYWYEDDYEEYDFYDNDPLYYDDDFYYYDDPRMDPTWGYGMDFYSWNYQTLFNYVFDGYCWDTSTGCHEIVGYQFGDTNFWRTDVRGHLISTKFLKLYDSSWFWDSYPKFSRSGNQKVLEGTLGIPIYPIYEEWTCTSSTSGHYEEVCPEEEDWGTDDLEEEWDTEEEWETEETETTTTACEQVWVEGECTNGYYKKTESYKAIDFMVFYVRVKFDEKSALRAGESESVGVHWKNGNIYLTIDNAWYQYQAPTVFALPTQFLGMDNDLNNPFRFINIANQVIELEVTTGERMLREPPIGAVAKESFEKTSADENGQLVLKVKDAGVVAGETTMYEVELRISNANDGFGQNAFGRGDLSCYKGEILAEGANTSINFHEVLDKMVAECKENGNLRDGKKYYASLRVKRESSAYTGAYSKGQLATRTLSWSVKGEAREGGGLCGTLAGSERQAGTALVLLLSLLGALVTLRRR